MQENIEISLKKYFEDSEPNIKLLFVGKIIDGFKDKDTSLLQERFKKSSAENDEQDLKGYGKLRILVITRIL
jgi:hypothetical protein